MRFRRNMSRFSCAVALLLAVSAAACSGTGGETTNNGEQCTGKCDDTSDYSLYEDLEGRDDPVAAYLRDAANDDGTIGGDYRDFLDGVRPELGCEANSEKTFVILMSRKQYFPRNIVTFCSEDPVEASKFFFSTQSDFGDLEDINPRDFKMAAWDSEARKYNLYEVKADDGEEGPMFVDVEPPHCMNCHTGPTTMDAPDLPFTPVMNELTNPWTLWNAEPDFRSHQFEDTIDPSLLEAPIYSSMTEGSKLGPAADFETTIRASMDRVVGARLYARRNEPDVEEMLNLMRPLYCDESVNYASENHFTGDVSTAIIIDEAIRQMYFNIRPDDWPYDWLNDGRMRLGSTEEGEEPINVMPVRGEATLKVEVGLVTRRSLTPYQILRVRALDWKKPVFSEFRCGIYEDARERILADPPDTSEMRRNTSLIPVLYDEIMKLEVRDPMTAEMVEWDLVPSEPEHVISIPDASDPDVREKLTYGLFEEFETDVDGFAAEIETYFDDMQNPGSREILEAERRRRGCIALQRYPSAPEVPNIGECGASESDL